MKTRKKYLLVGTLLLISVNVYSQFIPAGPITGDRYGITTTTPNDIKAIGIGKFTNVIPPQSALNVNSNLLTATVGNPLTFLPSEVFRTDAPLGLSVWRMFTGPTPGATERLALFTSTGWLLNAPANISSDINFRASSGNAFFWTNSGASPTATKRMMINSNMPANHTINLVNTATQPGWNTDGYVGIGFNTGTPPIWDVDAGGKGPHSLLHLQGNTNIPPIATGNGWRGWMRTGTYTTENSDEIYVGLKNESILNGPNRSDAVIMWGDDQANVDDGTGDNFRLIFSGSSTGLGNGGPPTDFRRFDGMEILRATPFGKVGIGPLFAFALPPARRLEILDYKTAGGSLNEPQLRLTYTQAAANNLSGTGVWTDLQTMSNGDLYIHPRNATTNRNVGINTSTPQKTLEIDSNDPTASPGNSGLRLTDLTSGSNSTGTYTKFLTVDPAGDVVLGVTPVGGGGVNVCGSYNNPTSSGSCTAITISNLISYVPKFGNASGTEICNTQIVESNLFNIGIGTTSILTPGAKLRIVTPGNACVDNAYGLDVLNNTTGLGGTIGIKAEASGGVGNGNINIGGTFHATANSTNYGIIGYADNIPVAAIAFNYGGHFYAKKAANNYGIKATAHESTAATGGSNIAGYFGADNGNLTNSTATLYGIQCQGSGSATSQQDVYGIQSRAYGGGYNMYGGFFEANAAENYNFGVYSTATGNGNTVLNYGVYASTAINAAACTTVTGACNQAAGYFSGDLAYTGTLYNVSDLFLKQNIQPLANASTILSQLNPVTFNFRANDFPSMHLDTLNNFGFIAEEVLQTLPELTKHFAEPAVRDSLGNIIHPQVDFLALDYTSVIPILVKAFQEQKVIIDSLVAIVLNPIPQQQQNPNENNNGNSINVTLSSKTVVLNQNKPNPFKEQTTIEYFISDDMNNVKIIFTDAKGDVLKEVEILEKGKGQLNVYAADLSSGIYTYTIVANGISIDSKRMMKTK